MVASVRSMICDAKVQPEADENRQAEGRKTMTWKTSEIDGEVLDALIGYDYVSIMRLSERGFRVGTLRGSLQRLLADGYVERRWSGNQRFGKFEYRIREGK